MTNADAPCHVSAGVLLAVPASHGRTLTRFMSCANQPSTLCACWSAKQRSVRSRSHCLTRHAVTGTSSRCANFCLCFFTVGSECVDEAVAAVGGTRQMKQLMRGAQTAVDAFTPSLAHFLLLLRPLLQLLLPAAIALSLPQVSGIMTKRGYRR